MADGEGGEAGGRAAAPPRPTIALPPRPPLEALFLLGGRGGGGAWDVSPGPMTLVSSFFGPDSEYQSFSQLLAGAIASPRAASSPLARPSTASAAEGATASVEERRDAAVTRPTFFMVPSGLSPGGLLNSPTFFGSFGMSHQEALAQVTAQAAQAHSHMHIEEEYPSSLSAATTAPMAQPTDPATGVERCQQMPSLTLDGNDMTFRYTEGSHSDEKSQVAAPVGHKPVDDGYNWRKYGQKQVKSSECPRSYYKCTHPNCPVKKKVERSHDGQVTGIIYRGEHNHQRPSHSRHAKEDGALPSGSSETGLQGHPKGVSRLNETITASSTSKRDRESARAASEQVSGSSEDDVMGATDVRTDEGNDSDPEIKRRNTDPRVTESTSHRTLTEPRIIVQTTSEVDLLDDGYRWRKYGQKVVKGNPNPRSYYKCTFMGCNVRKHVERASTDPKSVITTYEGKHDHDVPAARKSSHNTANAAAAAADSRQLKVGKIVRSNQAYLNGRDLRNNVQRPVAIRQLKEEHEISS